MGEPAPFRASFRQPPLLCPTQNYYRQAFDSTSLPAIKILPGACTELFNRATSGRAQHQHFVVVAISRDQALEGALLSGVMTAGCGGSGFWLLHVGVNVNYLAIQANCLGIKSLQAVNYTESLGSTTHPPKNQLSCLQPGLSRPYGWSMGGFPMISWKDVGLPANSCVFS